MVTWGYAPGSPEVAVQQTADGMYVSFPCPDGLAGRPAEAGIGSGPETHRLQCPSTPGERVRVRLSDPKDPATLVVIGRGSSTDLTETGLVDLVPGARLQVALAVTGFPPPGPARFRITASNSTAQTSTVIERRLDPQHQPDDRGWVRLDVDLDPVRRALGRGVRFRFDASADGAAEHLALPVWGDPVIAPPRSVRAPGQRRNVILVSIDTLRFDKLGCYGARPPTPVLDTLASEGALCETVSAPAPWTLPSHVSMMTGLYPCVHGITKFELGQPLPPGIVPLAERLRAEGYTTAAFTEDGLVDATTFSRGFGVYREERAGVDGQGVDRVRQTIAAALKWLHEEAVEPFFIFVHTYQVHDPYFSPPPFNRHAARAKAAEPERQALVKYAGAVQYTDFSLTPLIPELRTPALLDRVLLVVTSDHGEGFGERGYIGHGRTLHEEVLRVPLLWWAPGLIPRGRRVEGLVGLIDVPPTILDLLGLPVPDEMQGTSLAPQLRGPDPPARLPARTLFSENSTDWRGNPQVYRLAARGERWKTVWDPEGVQRFDLDHDPAERTPITDVPDAAPLRTDFERACADLRSRLVGSATTTTLPPARWLDPDKERQLRKLGYIE